MIATWKPQPGPQTYFLTCPVEDILFGGARGGGKCLPLDEQVLTPFGWKSMNDIYEGSQVCNPDGSISRVLNIYRPGIADIYELKFSDGATVRCDDGHLWLGKFVGRRIKRRMDGKLWRFGEIRRRYENNKDARFLIPLTDPVAFVRPRYTKHGDMRPVDPYLLGVLLGDGSLTQDSIRYSSKDTEIDDYCRAFGDIRIDANYNRRIVNCPALKKELVKIGLWGKRSESKFVPEPYLWGTVKERIALLQGLMDTDGTVDKEGRVSFTSSSKKLAEDVQVLARSLGFKATLSEGKATPCLTSYPVYIRGNNQETLFRLERKKERARYPRQNWHNVRRLMNIKHVGKAEVGCFEVDNPNGLFITRDFIVTHNSDGLLGSFAQHAASYGRAARGILFRRSYPELEELIERSKELYGRTGSAGWGASSKRWGFRNGATLRMRYLDSDDDADRYQGHSYTWAGIDEMGAFKSPVPIDKIRATLRTPHPGVICEFKATANPLGVGHDWIKKRYRLGRNSDGGFIQPTMTPFYDEEKRTWRVYIPSRLQNNKILMESDPGYVDRIHASGPAWLVKAWLDGDWDARQEGAMFKRELWRYYSTLPKEYWLRIHSWDTAFKKETTSDYSVCVCMIVCVQGSECTFYLTDVWRDKVEFPELKRVAGQMYMRDKPQYVLVEDHASGQSLIQEMKRDAAYSHALETVRKDKDKLSYANAVMPDVEAGRVYLPEQAPWLTDFIGELELFGCGGSKDDQVDAFTQAVNFVKGKVGTGFVVSRGARTFSGRRSRGDRYLM